MKHALLAILPAAMFLSGCCSTEKFEQRLNTYIHRSKVDVVQDFGPPIRTQSFGDVELVTFLRDRTYFDEGRAPSMQHYSHKKKDGTYEDRFYMDAGTPGHYEYRTCEITFRFQRGVAVSWSHNGNDCCDD